MDNNFYWARVYPQNPKRKHTIINFHCENRLWKGGDGYYKVPTWTKVTPDMARRLLSYKQSDRDYYAPRVFQIVTELQRRKIDAHEDNLRLARHRGHITEMPRVTAPEEDMLPNLPIDQIDGALDDQPMEDIRPRQQPGPITAADYRGDLPVDLPEPKASAPYGVEDATKKPRTQRQAALRELMEDDAEAIDESETDEIKTEAKPEVQPEPAPAPAPRKRGRPRKQA